MPARRELTREAAIAAGLPENLVLLEEPQAAVYAWLADRGDAWRRELKVGDTLLVCDVGGGTTDLTLIGVTEEEGELVAATDRRRQSHPVGGDNMDLALAHLRCRRVQGEEESSSIRGSRSRSGIPAARPRRRCLPPTVRKSIRSRSSAAAAS